MEYKLKFLLNSLTLKIKQIEDLGNAAKMSEFNNTHYDKKKVQGFCSVDDPSRFPVFNVPLCKDSIVHTVYFCEVAVGDSLFVGRQYAEKISPPTGIDSLITDGSSAVGFLNETGADLKGCAYVVSDPDKVLMLYRVTFEYDEEFEKKSRGKILCGRCRTVEAVMFCPAETASFCAECDALLHAEHFHSLHERRYFSDVGQKKFNCCIYHPLKTVDYFCDECNEAICAECQITGKHSSEEFSRHKIKPFIDACRTASGKVEGGSAVLQALSEFAQCDMAAFNDTVDGFRSNIASIRRSLEEDFKLLMQELDTMENYHRQSLNARYIDRAAKQETIKQMINYPRELDPADILAGLSIINEQRKPEKLPIFEKVEVKQFEMRGKVAISEVKPVMTRSKGSKAEDLAVTWRVETMGMDSKTESTIN